MSQPNIDIKSELNKYKTLLMSDFLCQKKDTFTLVTDTLRGNTVRAFTFGKCYTKFQPKSIFVSWANNYLNSSKNFENLQSGSNFEKLHKYMLVDLREFWFETEPKLKNKMNLYFFTKMTDLLFKSIARWDKLDLNRREWFVQNIHVPIDKYSLKILKACHINYSNIKTSMDFVGDEMKLYKKIQNDIRETIYPHYPILFDLYAWDFIRKKEIEKNYSFGLKKIKPK